MTETFREIIDSLYIARDWNEVQEYITELINGNDPLYIKRQSILSKISSGGSSIEKIIEDLHKSIAD